jgi:hypothetical protein
MRNVRIAALWRLVVFSSLSLVACGSGGGVAAPASSGGGTAASPVVSTPPSVTTADPLQGEWHQTFTCEENVRTFQRRMSSLTLQQRQEAAAVAGNTDASLATLLKEFTRGFAWGPNAKTARQVTPDALCKGASERGKVMRLQEGRVVISNDWDHSVELGGTYRVLDAHTFLVNDGNQDLEGTYRFTFEIKGDLLTFKKIGQDDPWGDNEFATGAAPWIRLS